jgi:hypothetical protein
MPLVLAQLLAVCPAPGTLFTFGMLYADFQAGKLRALIRSLGSIIRLLDLHVGDDEQLLQIGPVG